MSESFAEEIPIGKGDRLKTFHFRKIWYEGFINPKYSISAEGMDTVHMIRDEEGTWILEHKIKANAETLQLEKQFAKAITENLDQKD